MSLAQSPRHAADHIRTLLSRIWPWVYANCCDMPENHTTINIVYVFFWLSRFWNCKCYIYGSRLKICEKNFKQNWTFWQKSFCNFLTTNWGNHRKLFWKASYSPKRCNNTSMVQFCIKTSSSCRHILKVKSYAVSYKKFHSNFLA